MSNINKIMKSIEEDIKDMLEEGMYPVECTEDLVLDLRVILMGHFKEMLATEWKKGYKDSLEESLEWAIEQHKEVMLQLINGRR